jgi:hypothetical protein
MTTLVKPVVNKISLYPATYTTLKGEMYDSRSSYESK